MSINTIDKLRLYSYDGILRGKEKTHHSLFNSVDEFHKQCWRKEAGPKQYLLYDFIFINFNNEPACGAKKPGSDYLWRGGEHGDCIANNILCWSVSSYMHLLILWYFIKLYTYVCYTEFMLYFSITPVQVWPPSHWLYSAI